MNEPCPFCGGPIESSFISKYVFLYKCYDYNCQAQVEIIAANQKAADEVFNSRFYICCQDHKQYKEINAKNST